MKKLAWLFCLVFTLLLLALPARAQSILYAATGSNASDGSLYTVDLNTQTFSLVAPIATSGGTPLGMTGLAFSSTGTLYGITINGSGTVAPSLVTINTTTGVATVIGGLGVALSDISFRSNGTLYGFQAGGTAGGTRSLYTINLATGVASAVGASGLTATHGGGLAFSPGGTLYLSATNADGTLDTLNPANGARTPGPALTGAPFVTPGTINAMAFNAAGTLYGSNSGANVGSPPVADTELVTISLSGVVTDLFSLPGNTDAIAFAPIPEPSIAALFALGGVGSVALAIRRRRS